MEDLFIRKVCDGDENAYRYFIQQYKDMAFNIAFSVVKDEFTAQEITQDAFLKAYGNLSSFNRKSSFSTWFYRIVTNESLMYLRKNKIDFLEMDFDELGEIADESIIKNIEHAEQSRLINEALLQLNPKESLALRLFYLEEESVQQVCEITGWSVANAKVILHRARKNMYAVLSKLINQNQ